MLPKVNVALSPLWGPSFWCRFYTDRAIITLNAAIVLFSLLPTEINMCLASNIFEAGVKAFAKGNSHAVVVFLFRHSLVTSGSSPAVFKRIINTVLNLRFSIKAEVNG